MQPQSGVYCIHRFILAAKTKFILISPWGIGREIEVGAYYHPYTSQSGG